MSDDTESHPCPRGLWFLDLFFVVGVCDRTEWSRICRTPTCEASCQPAQIFRTLKAAQRLAKHTACSTAAAAHERNALSVEGRDRSPVCCALRDKAENSCPVCCAGGSHHDAWPRLAVRQPPHASSAVLSASNYPRSHRRRGRRGACQVPPNSPAAQAAQAGTLISCRVRSGALGT